MFSKRSDRIGLAFSLKLSMRYALLFVAGAAGMFMVVYLLVNSFLENREQAVLAARMQEYQAWYIDGGMAALKNRFDKQTESNADIFFIRLIGPRTNTLFISMPPDAKPIDARQLQTLHPTQKGFWQSIDASGDKTTWLIAAIRLNPDTVMQAGKSSTQSQELMTFLQKTFLKFALPILLLAIGAGAWVTFRAIGPIRRLISTVKDIIATGELNKRVPVEGDGRSELNALVALFNDMLNRNDLLIQAMHNSLDNVAHDLRTPMTRLRVVAEMALQHPENHDACLEALGDCMEESERVLTMLNVLMDVAEAETGAMRLDMTTLSLPDLIRSVVDLYDIVADERRIRIDCHLPDDLTIVADRTRLQQAIANLIDNAVKYSRDGRQISIRLEKQADCARIEIQDQGMGIAPDDIDQIWNRLYRGDRSRARRGLGLGLSFVKAIVEAHGGRVSVVSQPNQGARFTLVLPRTVAA